MIGSTPDLFVARLENLFDRPRLERKGDGQKMVRAARALRAAKCVSEVFAMDKKDVRMEEKNTPMEESRSRRWS